LVSMTDSTVLCIRLRAHRVDMCLSRCSRLTPADAMESGDES
jgi:hypothetical protein